MANQTQVAAGAVAGLFFTLLRIEDVIFAATSLRSTEPPRSFERNSTESEYNWPRVNTAWSVMIPLLPT
jgi:hypothetical protein